MLRSRILQSVLLSFIISFVALSDRVCAEPMLIVELQNRDSCFDCSPTGTVFDFTVAILNPNGTAGLTEEWSFFATPTDVGETIVMPPELLPVFNTVLTHPNDIYGALSIFFNHSFDSPPKLNYTDTGTELVYATRVAPNLGPNLSGYFVTRITQTVDKLEYINITPSRYRGIAIQTVRIYGDVVPEPIAFLHVVTMSVLIGLRIRIARRKLSPIAC